ncbi:MAG TPA: DUF6448 family protein [Bacteroidales bacterium]|nr:DUF6448 family protein [Bacteroidales bacterium]
MKTKFFKAVMMILFISHTSGNLYAHCDTMDGPVVADARKALDQNNVNYVLKWIRPEFEKEVVDAFNQALTVRSQSTDAREIADMYFFEKVVRLHRQGENVAFTGIKPSGTPVDEKILAADKSIELGNLDPLDKLVPVNDQSELKERFSKVITLKNFDVNDVAAGREYIEAYVQFFHFAEGEEHQSPVHDEEIIPNRHQNILPWVTTGFFFLSTLILFIMLLKRKSTI